MDPKLEEFFAVAENERKEKLREERASVLLSAGLYNEEREYSKTRLWGSRYDYERKEYYTARRVPIDVTDEEYGRIQRILSERSPESRPDPVQENTVETPVSRTTPRAESILGTLAAVELAVRLVLVVIIIACTFILHKYAPLQYDSVVLAAGLVSAAMTAVVAVILWAYRRVIVNISENLYNINAKQKS